ncbi:hypothetical protein [Campylobacter sp.]|uniref:hypothetical protein n=1 Tax=Campylobacter sp. TaxID=205 RepID=UPI0026FBD9D2|nr:hypothetical protein [Campylobacter sp.]
MKIQEEFASVIKDIEAKNTDIIDKFKAIMEFIRPKNLEQTDLVCSRMDVCISFFNEKTQPATAICDEINLFFINLKLSINLSNFGILSKNGFAHEIKERFYNKFLPNPPDKGELRYIFATIFNKKDDYVWIENVSDEKWLEFFSSIFLNSTYTHKVKIHLFHELLDAVEILSIRVASQEFDESFIRLDKSLLSRDSAFIALQRDINKFVYKLQDSHIDISSIQLDFKHLEVLITQCMQQIEKLKKRSVNMGISINVTYNLQRLTQIIKRIEFIIRLIKNFDTRESNLALLKMFKESVKQNASKNSLMDVYRQSSKIIAKSITNNIGEHGEHYIADDKKDYLKMFLSSAGAGVIIAIMALLKINIVQAGFSQGVETILSSLNYGLGFVFIHLIGFTVATKQPAMTASTFAQEVERDEDNMANQNKLIELIFKVSRSQFASVLGNVSLALLISFVISYLYIKGNEAVINEDEARYYLKGLLPISALFYAATAGIWLFCSGLIAGYFDNRADYLELRQRYFHHPVFKKLFSEDKRRRLAYYLHDHHGAIAGNFFFGVLLGITPFVGYLLDLPLNIAHVAFSSAYLGYSFMHVEISICEFFYYLSCALMIGLVNLIVSFVLALKVSLVSRDTSIGNFFMFVKRLFLEILKRPHHLFLPFKDKNN